MEIIKNLADWLEKAWNIICTFGEFLVYVWNSDDRWWGIAGMFVIGVMIFKILFPIYVGITDIFRSSPNSSTRTSSHNIQSQNIQSKKMATVTIKGTYQMNGPKPFSRTIECSSSETGYYSQLMGNKSKQAQWISANFPGADTSRGFSMSVNIK